MNKVNKNLKKKTDEYLKEYGERLLKKPLIYLDIGRLDGTNLLFEEFLLSDKPMEESTLYKFIERKRNDKEYLDQVKYGLALVEKDNKDRNYEIFKTKIGIGEVLGKVSGYIEEQSGDLKNKERKLYVLDQYYRILRYQNDGKIYTSGVNLNLHDVSSLSIPLHDKEPSRDKKDIGVTKNSFITAITSAPYYEDNWSIFTESEKQQKYLEYHDELPCDLEIACELEEEYVKTKVETRLYRPENTAFLWKKFYY